LRRWWIRSRIGRHRQPGQAPIGASLPPYEVIRLGLYRRTADKPDYRDDVSYDIAQAGDDEQYINRTDELNIGQMLVQGKADSRTEQRGRKEQKIG
jgi:hypothetical protein